MLFRIVMSDIDPVEKAAECERALAIVSDAPRRALLENLQALWIELLHVRAFLSESDFAQQLEAVGKIHARLLGSDATTVH
jgi:hypothetical protein